MGSRRAASSVVLLDPHMIDLGFGTPRATLVRNSDILHGGGGYTGARSDRAGLKDWLPRLDSADAATLPDLPALRSRARDLARNNPIAESALRTVVDNAVGTGLVPVPQPDADYLGLTQNEAAAWALRAERVWWAWAGTTACDLGRRLNFGRMQGLTLRSELESGDILVVRRYRPRPGDLLGLKLQLVEADRISTPRGKTIRDGIVDGVEIDRDGAASGFYVQDGHPGDQSLALRPIGQNQWRRVAANGAASGDAIALHLYTQLRPGQTRGVPYLAVIIERVKQLGRYDDAEIMAAVITGMITYSITSQDSGDVPPSMASVSEDDREADAADGQFRIDYGAVFGLQPGETLNMHAPTRPSGNYEGFVMAVVRSIGAGLGIPAGVLLQWFTKSYSASRAEWMLAWKHFTTRRDHIAWDFSHVVYGWVIEEAIARRLLDAPGFFDDPLTREAWLGCDWRGSPPGQLDPFKEIQAIEKRRALRISTLAQDTAETTGGDWRANLRQLSIEAAEIERLGLAAAPAPAATSEPPMDAAPAAPDDSEEGDEE